MADTLNNLESTILRILETHQGKDFVISRKDLVDYIRQEPSLFFLNERKIRETIKHLVTQHGYAIGSNPKGYYIAVTPQEIEEVCAYYDRYVHSMAFVSSRLKKIGMREYYGQMSMRFGS